MDPAVTTVVTTADATPTTISLTALTDNFHSIIAGSAASSVTILADSETVAGPGDIERVRRSINIVPDATPTVAADVTAIRYVLVFHSFLVRMGVPSGTGPGLLCENNFFTFFVLVPLIVWF